MEIKKIRYNGTHKTIELSNNAFYDLSFSTSVDEGSRVIHEGDSLFVECENGYTQIYPSYCDKDRVEVGAYSIDILIKEITSDNEFKSYESLSQFHYKGQRLFGRTAVLIATTSTPYLPKVLGYIELTTPFYVNKPRARVFDAPFSHNGVTWEKWDKNTTKRYINLITRIARCVVYPEFRGVGLGQILVEHSISFAKTRWQISNLKPLFLEISADMLKYVPFAEKVGMHYVGDTEGNINRISKDLTYLISNHKRVKEKEIVSQHQMGIVEQQKSRLRKAMKIIEENNLTIDAFLKKLELFTKKRTLKDLQFFNGLVSLPKPTYIKGLDEVSDKFIKERAAYLLPDVGAQSASFDYSSIDAPIQIHNLTIKFNSKIRSTNKTNAIYNAFNLNPQDLNLAVIKKVSFEVKPGEIMLITGSSGAGKTTLLNLLAKGKNKSLENQMIEGEIGFPSNYKAVTFRDINSSKPLIEIFGAKDLNYGLKLMGLVGLSDAYLYLKKYSELSKGQQFRAQLAYALLHEFNTLIIDEFCSNLDPITANVVTYRLRKLVKRAGITLIIGAAHCDSFIHSLDPDKVLRLSTAWDYEVLNGTRFLNQFTQKKQQLDIQVIKLTKSQLSSLLKNQFITLILNEGNYELGQVIIKSEETFTQGYIKKLMVKPLNELTDYDLHDAGYKSLKHLQKDICINSNVLDNEIKVFILSLSHFDFRNQNNCKTKMNFENG